MAGAMSLANAMQTLDPAGSMQRGQSMAMNQMQMQGMQQQQADQQQLRTLKTEAMQGGAYSPEAHKEILMNAGFFEEAQDIDDLMSQSISNKQQALEKGLNLVEKTGGLVQSMGAPAWPVFRGSLIAAGLADESSLPVEYNEQAAQMAQSITQKANDTFRLLHFRSGNQQRDVMNIGGKITMGDPYSPGSQTALEKNTKFLADTMGITPEESAQIMIQSKDKSDAAVYQDLYKTALRATYGDQAEAAKIARDGLNAVREFKPQPADKPKPVLRPGAEPKAAAFEEGKTYTDAAGNKAKYVNGQWEPVQ